MTSSVILVSIQVLVINCSSTTQLMMLLAYCFSGTVKVLAEHKWVAKLAVCRDTEALIILFSGVLPTLCMMAHLRVGNSSW